jgi:hypothetical protein
MYDVTLTHQSLPSEKYIRLLGIAVSVFSSNNAFIIENILRTNADTYSWHSLIDKESGQLRTNISETISRKAGKNIEQKFVAIVDKRNRIMHGFRITSNDGEQILGTKDKKTQEQFEITEEYLLHFIHENDELSKMLHDYRGH